MQLKLCNYLRSVKVANISIIMLALCLYFCLSCCLSSCESLPDKQKSSENTVSKVDLNRSAKYNIQLALGYLEQGDVERAKDKLLKAVKQAPELPEVHYNLAHFYYLIDERNLADEHFNNAITLASKSETGGLGTAYNNYGVFLCQTEQYERAYEQFDHAINDSNYADNASAYENAGLCALKADNKKLAASYFESAIKKNPLAAKSLIELSQYNYDVKNYDKAKYYLQRYNQLNEHDKRALMLNLKLALAEGDVEQGTKISSSLLGKFPEMKEEVARLSKFTNSQTIQKKVRISPKKE